MSSPTVRKGRTVLTTSDPCPRCGHLISDHVEEKSRHCNRCACVAQDVHDPLKR